MFRKIKNRKSLLLMLTMLLLITTLCFGAACSNDAVAGGNPEGQQQEVAAEILQTVVVEEGHYNTPEEVAEYLHFYGHLPDNYLTKQEARELGWESNEGNLHEVAPGMSIGGDTFGNREGLLPKAKGRKYYECDVNYEGGYRNAERLVYSNDGLIFYTNDHYESFEQLYGEKTEEEAE